MRTHDDKRTFPVICLIHQVYILLSSSTGRFFLASL